MKREDRKKEKWEKIKSVLEIFSIVFAICVGVITVKEFNQDRRIEISHEFVLPLLYASDVEYNETAIDYVDNESEDYYLKEKLLYEKGCLYDVFIKNPNSRPKTIESWGLKIEKIEDINQPYLNVFPVIKDEKIIFYCINDSNYVAQNISFSIRMSLNGYNDDIDMEKYLDEGYDTLEVFLEYMEPGEVVEIKRFNMNNDFKQILNLYGQGASMFIDSYRDERIMYRGHTEDNGIIFIGSLFNFDSNYYISFTEGDGQVAKRNVYIDTNSDEGKEKRLKTQNTKIEDEEEVYMCLIPNNSCKLTYKMHIIIDGKNYESEGKTTKIHVPFYKDSDGTYVELTEYMTSLYNGEKYLNLKYDYKSISNPRL